MHASFEAFVVEFCEEPVDFVRGSLPRLRVEITRVDETFGDSRVCREWLVEVDASQVCSLLSVGV